MIPPIMDVGGVLISSEILTEYFCCDYEKCHGICCVEGDAGAPITLDEIAGIEDALDTVWPTLSASAQSVIDHQGVAYTDKDGELVTSIVRGRECVFAREMLSDSSNLAGDQGFSAKQGRTEDSCWLCMLERAYRNGQTSFCKPISCSLYPIREKTFSDGLVGLNYNKWDVCRDAVIKGTALKMPVYKFLREPLIRRFGEEWYEELCEVARQLGLS